MTQKIIEIIGPPGVGKSTIYKSLCREWKPSLNWTHQDALLSPRKPAFFEFISWLEYQSRRALGKKASKNVPTEFGLRFVANNPELASFYWDQLSDPRIYNSSDIDKRFRSAYLLFNDFCRYQAVLEKAYRKPCIINEGLLQKSFFVNEDHNFIDELLKTYLSLIPLPYAVIFINTSNTNTIYERLKNRKKIIASHIDKDETALKTDIEKWQSYLMAVNENIQRYKVSILPVDGEKSVKENVKHISSILEGL